MWPWPWPWPWLPGPRYTPGPWCSSVANPKVHLVSNFSVPVPTHNLDLDPQGHSTPLGAMTHLSHQYQGTPSQQLLGPSPNAWPWPSPYLDPRATVHPWGAMAHLSHQSRGTSSQQLLGPTSLVPTHDLHLDPRATVHPWATWHV